MFYHNLYNNATTVCIFIACCPWSIRGYTRGYTHRWRQIHGGYTHRWRQIHVWSGRRLLFWSFSMPQTFHKIFNKLSQFLLYKIFPCVCSVIDHKRRQRVKATVTPLDFISCGTFCSLHVVTSSVTLLWNVCQLRYAE